MTQQPNQGPPQPQSGPAPMRPSYVAGSGRYPSAEQRQQQITGQAQQYAAQLPVAPEAGIVQQGSPSRVSAALARARVWARPAGTGLRLLGYTIDVLLAAVLSAVAGLLTGSVLIAGIVLLEFAVIVLIIESRTGATPAQLLLRIRTTRDDSPYSIAFGRALLRGVVQGASALVAVVGGWIMVSTSAGDPMRAGRSLADRAGRALVVRVPTRAERASEAVLAAENAPHGPRVSIQRPGASAVETQLVPARQVTVRTPQAPQRPLPPEPQQAYPQSVAPGATGTAGITGGQPGQGVVPVAPPSRPTHGMPWDKAPARAESGLPVHSQSLHPTTPPQQAQLEVFERSAAAAPANAAPAPAPAPVFLMLNFDTGQRERVDTEVSMNLGRRPVPAQDGDRLITVRDPDGTVSKTHLRIEHRAGVLWLIDQGSTNGSEVFGEDGQGIELGPGERVLLDEGSRVRIGNRSFTVAFVEAD